MNDNEIEGGKCPHCGEPAKERQCAKCGKSAWIIDCGHMGQPRPISAGREDGSDASNDYCEDCAPIEVCAFCGLDIQENLAMKTPLEWRGEYNTGYCHAICFESESEKKKCNNYLK